MAEPHRSRTPAPRQPSPTGSGAAWFTSPIASRSGPASARSLSDRRRRLLSIHYPRSVPVVRPCPPHVLADVAQAGGRSQGRRRRLHRDVRLFFFSTETYVFWNGQETAPGKYYFKERFDQVQFARVVKDAGLYLMLRIGLFVPAEWNFGGVPAWLHYIPTTVFRNDNEPFKSHMNEGAAAGDDYGHFPLKLASNLYLGSVWRHIEWTVIMYSISLKTRIGSIWKNGCFM